VLHERYTMSPTGVAVLLLLALVVDYMSIGPTWARDRLAFLMAVPALREGFDGSPADQQTVAAVAKLIQRLLDSTGTARIAGASANFLVGVIVGLVIIYVVGCLLPTKLSKRLGRFATLTFPQSPMYRLNGRLWAAAAVIGMMSDLPGGLVGDAIRVAVDVLTSIMSPIPAALFGAA
jgi:hypothetical protein